MPNSYMKLPYVDKVLQPDALRPLVLEAGPVGFSLDIMLNYYRGLPLSTIEQFELSVDGERVSEQLLLFEYNRKLFTLGHLRLAFAEFWSVKKSLRVLVYQGGLAAGDHDVSLTLILRAPYMQFAPGVWGMIDGSAERTLTLEGTA